MPPKTKGPYRKYAPPGTARRVKQEVSAVRIQKAVRTYLNKNIETKHASMTSTDYSQIGHNSFITLDPTLLATTQGITDPKATNTACRIGDNITLKGVSIRMMIELNNRYSDVSYRILIIKCAKGDTPSASNLYVGLSGNKMLDKIDRERYTVCYEKWGKITSRNMNMGSGGTVITTGLGNYEPSPNIGGNYQSRATKIIKIWLPYKRFQKSPTLQYENGSSQLKFFDYHTLIYAYSNYDTSELLGFNVLAVNDYVKEIYFKDA